MKRSAVQMMMALGIGAAILSFSCVEQHYVLRPPAAETTVTANGRVVPSNAEFEGTIGRIDPEAGVITVQHWPLSKVFKITPECQIDTLTNSGVVFAQLKVADAVVVTYAEVGKDLVASRIVRKGTARNREEEERMERLDEMLNPSPNQ